MNKKIFVLTILLLGAFVLFSPRASWAFSCKCTNTGEANKDNQCLSWHSENCGEIINGWAQQQLKGLSLDTTCQQYSDESCQTPVPDGVYYFQPTSPQPQQPTALDTLQTDLSAKKPVLEINIPGINFSDVASTSDQSGTYFYIPWIPELISGLYKFGLAIVSIIAVVVIILQGLRVIASGGGEGKTTAYKKIFQAVIGLFIAWGSYAILYNINPALVQFNALKVKVIQSQELPEELTMQTTNGNTEVPDQGGSEVGAYTPHFSSCPITLQNDYTPDKNSARTKEFYEKIGSVITGTTVAERALQIGDAAVACNVTFGSCGRTAGNIYNLAGLFSKDYPDASCLLTSHGCEAQGSKEFHHIPYTYINGDKKFLSKGLTVAEIRNTLLADPTLKSEGWPDAWANQLQPGDGLWVYNGNNSGGNHTAIFVGWAPNGRAQVIQGSAGTPVHRGFTLCIKSECGDKMLPIIKTYKVN